MVPKNDYVVAPDGVDHGGRSTFWAMFRRRRFEAALAATSSKITRGWKEQAWGCCGERQVETPDEWLARKLGLAIVSERKLNLVDGVSRTVTEHSLLIPSFLRVTPGSRGVGEHSRLFDAVRCQMEFTGAIGSDGIPNRPQDEVVEIVLPDGRIVCAHSFMSRIEQRMWLSAVVPRTDPMMLPFSHAYRPGRSRFTAVEDVRDAVRQGYFWATDRDVRQFFPSIKFEYVDEALRHEMPWASRSLRDFGLSFLRVVVLRRPNHPDRRSGTALPATLSDGRILAGGPIAPFLANVVATTFVDRPLFELLAKLDVKIFRYSDNFLLLARDPARLDQALRLLEAALGVIDLRLHPDKGVREPVDLRKGELYWLGKVLRGGSVHTPEDRLVKMVVAITTTSTALNDFRSLAIQAHYELALDPASVRARFRRALEIRSPRHATCFDLVIEDHARRRSPAPRIITPEGEYLDFAYDRPEPEKGAVE